MSRPPFFTSLSAMGFAAKPNIFTRKRKKNMAESISSSVILVSNAATLMPFRPFWGILFRNFFMAGLGLKARVGEPTIKSFNPANCSGRTSPTRSIPTSWGRPSALPIDRAIPSVLPKNESYTTKAFMSNISAIHHTLHFSIAQRFLKFAFLVLIFNFCYVFQ
jgi:hypothetical protein